MSIDLIISTAWTDFKSHLAAPIGQQFRYVISYKSYRKDLEKQVGKLEYKMLLVQDKVAQARNNNKLIYNMVNKWQESAEKMVKEAREHLESEGKANKDTCCYGKLPNPKTRFVFSRMAKKMMEVIEQLVTECNEIKEIYYEGPPPGIVAADLTTHIDSTTLAPGRGGTVDAATLAMPSASDDDVYESRDEVVRHVMRALANESTNVVGVHGPGGVGKSTLLEEVERQIRKRRLFDVVAKADVSENPDIKEIQERIADYLGLRDINQSQDKRVRARKMHERLLQKDGNSKILIILDNLWKRLDLKEVGIPCGHDNKVVGCKLLLTSRSRDVLLKDMCSDEEFLLSELKEEEAQRLFRKIVGTKVDDREIKPLVDEVLKKCAGLPLLIVSIGKNLKHGSASTWRDFLRRIKVSNDGVSDVIYTTIERSYDHLGTNELKDLFIACAIAGHSSINSRDLLIYSMGLDLFGQVRWMEDARDTMKTLLHSLQASCLLQDSTDNNVKIHDLVREVAILIAKRRDKLVLVMRNDLKDWSADMLKSCYAISLPHVDIQELPEGWECPKLKFFFLESKNHHFAVPDSFFKSMGELKVLDLTKLHLTSLPSSIQFLENLQTLCLDFCCLDNVTILGKLRRLQVLSFVGSTLVRLPKEVGELTELRLLDLSHCSELDTIDPGTLGSLVQLEELYMKHSFDRWEAEDKVAAQSNACLIELNNMTKLSTLDISILDANVLPKDLPFGKLNKYRIHIGDVWDWSSEYKASRTLKLKLGSSSTLSGEWVQVTLQKTQDLYLHGLEGNKKSVQKLCREGFQELKYLHARDSPLIQYIVQSSEWQQSTAFMFLEALIIEGLINLEKICSGHLTKGSLSNLRVVKMESCDKLKNVFLHSLVRGLSQLEEIEVRNCKSMQEIISDAGTEDEEEEEERGGVGTVELRKLRRVTLESLPEIISFCTKTERASEIAAENELGATCAFFDEQQVTFPNIEELRIEGIALNELWHNEVPAESFGKLKLLEVKRCAQLLCVVPSFMLRRLHCLESLTVEDCSTMEFIYELKGQNFMANKPVRANRLTNLSLRKLPKLRHICEGDISGALCFRNLKTLGVYDCRGVKYIMSRSMASDLCQLQKIKIKDCDALEEVFIIEREEDDENEEPRFPMLDSVVLDSLPNLADFCSGNGVLECRILKTISVANCPKMDTFMSPLRKKQMLEIVDESGEEILGKGEIQVPATAFFSEKAHFPSLETLVISHVNSFEMIWDDHLPRDTFNKLKLIRVEFCEKLLNIFPFGSLGQFRSLETLQATDCNSLESIFKFPLLNSFAKNAAVGIPLKMLNLQDPQGTVTFQNLRKIEVRRCQRLKNVFPASVAQGLTKLENLSIGDCGIAELIFAASDSLEDGGDANASSIFPQLTSLRLYDLPQLKSLFRHWHTPEWPLLKELSVYHCDKFTVFSESCVINTENQLGISHQQALFSAEKVIPKLKLLALDSRDVRTIRDGKFREDILSNLETLILECFHDEKAVFPLSFLIQRFGNLERLGVRCCSFKEIFSDDLSGQDGMIVSERLAGEGKPIRAFGSLRFLELYNLHNLKHVWKEDSLAAEILKKIRYLYMEQCNSLTVLFPASATLKNLTVLEVEDCLGLKHLMMSSVAKSLVRLKKMSITKCNAIEEVVSDEGNRAGEEVRFLKLQHLELGCLDNLVSFSSMQCSFVFPCLEVVIVRQCPKMNIFSEGVCRTPKLDKVRASEEDEEGRWDSDLNTTIQKLSS